MTEVEECRNKLPAELHDAFDNIIAEAKKELLIHKPQLFISGHSHILKIMYDDKFQCLYMNPGAAGRQGWQKVRTILRFAIDGKEIKNCEVIELGKK